MKTWTPQGIATIKDTALHRVDQCLYIKANASGTKRWIFRYRSRVDSKLRQFAFGEYGKGEGKLSLAAARIEAGKYRAEVADLKDPKKERDNALKALKAATVPTFAECCAKYIALQASGWRNPKHKQQWENTLATYCKSINDLPVNVIDDHHITDVLESLWLDKHETARRLRGRIERVLAWATTRKFRSGLNPARLDGHMQELLPKVPKSKKKKRHHPALNYSQMHPFMKDLRKVKGTSARALEFLILTAARTGEVITMEWSEVDLDTAVWTIPEHKMKAERQHKVPLCQGAMKTLKDQIGQHERWVFPGIREGKHLSNMSMLELVRGMRPGITVHGFRSSFRTWAAEKTNVARLVCEAALAHSNDNDVEDAYLDTDFLEQRVALMHRWMKHCEQAPPKGNVTQIKTA